MKSIRAILLFLGLAVQPALAQTVVKYVHTDALGSIVAMTDESGAVIETTREYEPYGLQMVPSVQDGPGYTGHVQDAATGLTYMQQRYYDPICGCFLSVDPVTAYSKGDMRFFNRYAYAFSNPYRFSDPDGRCPACDRFGDQFKRDAEAGNLAVYEPFEKPALIATGAMLVGPPIVLWAVANPATATTIGTGIADAAMGDAMGGASLAAGGATLFRVVDSIEMKSIEKFGEFMPAPNGDTVKRFLDNLPDAKALAQKFSQVFGGEQHVVRGQASQAAMDASSVTRFSDMPGRPMNSVNVPNEQLQNVRCTGRVDGC